MTFVWHVVLLVYFEISSPRTRLTSDLLHNRGSSWTLDPPASVCHHTQLPLETVKLLILCLCSCTQATLPSAGQARVGVGSLLPPHRSRDPAQVSGLVAGAFPSSQLTGPPLGYLYPPLPLSVKQTWLRSFESLPLYHLWLCPVLSRKRLFLFPDLSWVSSTHLLRGYQCRPRLRGLRLDICFTDRAWTVAVTESLWCAEELPTPVRRDESGGCEENTSVFPVQSYIVRAEIAPTHTPECTHVQPHTHLSAHMLPHIVSKQ